MAGTARRKLFARQRFAFKSVLKWQNLRCRCTRAFVDAKRAQAQSKNHAPVRLRVRQIRAVSSDDRTRHLKSRVSAPPKLAHAASYPTIRSPPRLAPRPNRSCRPRARQTNLRADCLSFWCGFCDA